MEAENGNSNSGAGIKELNIESSWVPVTPLKPIYEQGEAARQAEAYVREFEEHFSVLSPISIAERSKPNGNNNLCETYRNPLRGIEILERQNNSGLRENACVLDSSGDDSLAQFNNMSFGDLLAMNTSPLELPSMVSTRFEYNNGEGDMSLIFRAHDPGLDCCSTIGTPQINGMYGIEMQSCAFLNQDGSLSNVKSHPKTELANGNTSTFVPPTPDLRWRLEAVVASGDTNPEGNQMPNEQSGFQEHEYAAGYVNLQEFDMIGVAGDGKDPSHDNVSIVVEENHNPDKGGEQGIDLNKTPQKKPRRKRYLPKVVSESKSKRTRKPRTPKPPDSKGTPRVKRKYVRKNKVNTPSIACPGEASETADPKPIEPATVKSCRKSLNFDLNERDMELKSLQMSIGGSYEKAPPTGFASQGNQSRDTVHLGWGEEVTVEKSQVVCELKCSSHFKMESYTSLPGIGQLESLSGPNSSTCVSSNERVQIRGSKRGHSSITDAMEGDAGNVATNHCAFGKLNSTLPMSTSSHGLPGSVFPEICKKKKTHMGQRSDKPCTLAVPAFEDVTPASDAINYSQTEAVASKYYCCNHEPLGGNSLAINRAAILMRNVQNRMHFISTWADIASLKRKRQSKGTDRVCDLSELNGITSVLPVTPAVKCPRRRMVDSSFEPYTCSDSYMDLSNSLHSCMESLTEDLHTMPRSKGRSRKQTSSRSSNVDKEKNHWELVLCEANKSPKKSTGLKRKGMKSSRMMYAEHKAPCPVSFRKGSIRWISTSSIRAITEGLRQLNIKRESTEMPREQQNALVRFHPKNQEQNTLVLYKNDGALVPFEGPFEPIRKRSQRAKVDLDDETTRVWRLLLENIDNRGINGTDEEKVKWWENERSVFQGRVDSFIARMRLVQGDRRFTPWKGSVLDSVIGVFLTQNVSDHLSSSAFMELAAHFPVNSQHNEGTLSVDVEPGICIIEPEKSITWGEKALDPRICDRKSRILHEMDHYQEKHDGKIKERVGNVIGSVISTNYYSESSQKEINESRLVKESSPTIDTEEASILGDDRARDDATSSQQSVISSQNSVSSPNFGAVGVMSSFSETSPTTQGLASTSYFDCSSFMGLLRMAEIPLLHESHSRIRGLNRTDCVRHVSKDRPEAPSTSSSSYQSHMQTEFHSRGSKYIEVLEAESRSSDTSRKDENSSTEQSNVTESTVHHFPGKEKALEGNPRSSVENLSFYDEEKMVVESQIQLMEGPSNGISMFAQGQTSPIWKIPKFSTMSQEADATESTTGFDRQNNYQKEIEKCSKPHHDSPGILDTANPSPSKPKSRPAREKRNALDWDSLRRQAHANGKKTERIASTRDSIDWEAVRLADVSEIADTIKARGMNNVLAERIKELLDRLVKEHGSTDLEWLRDIPPDKAKEYLLSFRGLGLKSVECVRLLTLHHLAFPVDTNVGRIAVRLGWVPLQPLPESLQLHLLELYPVLESIQKYLWPRLCKLDQKTLYELHYHMITFGKVFCTKRQPNCNACPLRGECRHFASAFASARLALPGPENRSIIASNGGSSAYLYPLSNIKPLPLPPVRGVHHEEANIRSNPDASIIEVPSTPLSLSLPQMVNELDEKSGIKNYEPIVEVPASPEPELEHEQTLCDIEDTLYEDPDEIPTIKLNMKQFTQTLENFMQANLELQEARMSNALVALTPEAASIPTPKLKNVSRLRTEHNVYEIPDAHPLLKGLDKRERDDPCSYLLAIWTPGETANSIEPPERRCSFEDPSILCNEVTCSYCSSQRETNSQIVRGTLLIPCRTAMKGSFPLNGTYFQVNEVFADHDSSLNPIEVPRSWLWDLPRRTVYFGTSIPTIFKGLTTEEIQHCFWKGYVCVRGFDQKTRAPRPLMARLHFPASKLTRGPKGKVYADDE